MSAPWLVAIDLQTIFATGPWGSAEYGVAEAGTRALLPNFVGRTVHTRFVAPAEPSGAWVDYYRDWLFALVPGDDPLYALTLDPGDDPVLTATTFGKWGPELAGLVTGSGDAAIVLTGVSTDCCVLSTALAAADAGVAVRVVADACAGASPADHQRALDAMALYGPLITITTVAEVLSS